MSEAEEPLEELADDLFAAGRAEAAPAGARVRALAALGLDAAVGGAAPDAGDGSGGGQATGAAPAAKAATLKVLAVVALAGAVGLGVWRASVAEPSPTTPPPTVATTATTAPVPTETAATSASTELPLPAAVPSATPSTAPALAVKPAAVTGPRPSAAPAAPASAPPPAAADALAAEIALLDRARARLRASDAPGALAELDRHAAEHPRGALASEATLLRIEALVLAGRREEARKIAAPLLERPPGDLRGDRARALLER